VRAGDTVYRNQPFLSVSDMKDLEMRCEVPESELTGIPLGGAAEVRPLAYPDLTLTGRVESVGSMAHSVAGRPAFQKYFGVRIRLGGWDARIRPGMSARARILSYSTPAAVLVPRVALWWEEDRAWCRVQTPGGVEKRAVSTRFADEARIEVLTGVEPGDRLILE
jgi:multidrug efflux pump subunit AcrA (membrane-fusion protein)